MEHISTSLVNHTCLPFGKETYPKEAIKSISLVEASLLFENHLNVLITFEILHCAKGSQSEGYFPFQQGTIAKKQ